MNKKSKYLLILLVLLLPTWFVNNNEIQDWGDDFAQYIYQSQKLNQPQSFKTILNSAEYGSQKRSLLFSEILSFTGKTDRVKPYKNLIALFYILSAGAVFLFLATEFSAFISLLLALCIFYNYHSLRLKGEIVPEFVFMTFLYSIFYLVQSPKKFNGFLIPVLLAFLICIRTIGVVFVIAYLIKILRDQEKLLKEKIRASLFVILSVSVIVIIINSLLLFNLRNSEFSFYKQAFFTYFNSDTILKNLQAYWHSAIFLFEQEVPFWIAPILIYLPLILMTIGIIKNIKEFSMIETAFFFYMFILIIYPYNGTSLRFLIPVFPFIFYYMVKGTLFVLSICGPIRKHTTYVLPLFLLVILLSNTKTVLLDLRSSKDNPGPYDPSITADLNKIRNLTDPSATIAFCKPFIINLFCDRNSYFLSPSNYKTISEKTDYVLVPKSGDIRELNGLYVGVNINNCDSIELDHFYLLKHRH